MRVLPAAALSLLVLLGAGIIHAQTPVPPASGPIGAAPAKGASAPVRPVPSASGTRAAKASPTSPLWTELTPAQQEGLAPLASRPSCIAA
jgi:hypothetical protein